MVLTSKHRKSIPYTDEEIEQYCESVEKLLVKIKEDSLSKKRRKTREVEVQVEAEAEHIPEDENEFEFS